jgi:DNA-binding MarR family transcriptional regulator
VPTDRRSYALHPTEAGRSLYRETLDAVTQHEAELLSGIAPEQLEQMIATLKLIESAKKGKA